jgi:large subunit ribosomal protein L19
MSQDRLIESIEKEYLKSDLPEFSIGDTLNVHTRIIEGDKERVQVFSGTLVAHKGSGLSQTISLYRVSNGSGIQRVFMPHSPKVAKIEISRRGDVRRAKLYDLLGSSGKASKVKEQIGGKRLKKNAPIKTEPTA